ncbi:Aste57867_9224 [Aphanomyces stellatus]|uniref:Aste57867_9224 protein n=1 Tax=Aphanomyces stellatus TaxID=120398 RepID=A0A485KME9_9STRA|nr:hypothetical protein As57867_009188 [Aphanomyces stellatus]VFT86107.1 Aste57867_9224 [Aphanomyces stellatus]
MAVTADKTTTKTTAPTRGRGSVPMGGVRAWIHGGGGAKAAPASSEMSSMNRFASVLFRRGCEPKEKHPPRVPEARHDNDSVNRVSSGILDGMVHFMTRGIGSVAGDGAASNEDDMGDELQQTIQIRKFSRFRALESRIGDWRMDATYRRRHVQIFVNAMFGLVLAVANLLIYPISTDHDILAQASMLPTTISNSVCVEAVISLSTFILVCQLWSLHKLYEREKRLIWGDGFNMRYWNYENTGKALLEFVVVVVHPFPMHEAAIYREGATVWMFMRFYLLIRVLKDHSAVYRKRKEIVEENFQHSSAPAFTWWLTMQMVFSHTPDLSLLTFCAWCILVFALGTYMCERDVNPDEFTLVNSTWYVYTTFLTLDIAEFTVGSWSGRTVTCLLIAAGVVMNTLVVVAILDNVTLDAKGKVALAYVHRNHAQENIRKAAGAFIVSWVRWHRAKAKPLDVFTWTKLRLKVARTLEAMRIARYRKQITEQSLGDPILDKLESMDMGIMKIYHKVSPELPPDATTAAAIEPAPTGDATRREQRVRRKSVHGTAPPPPPRGRLPHSRSLPPTAVVTGSLVDQVARLSRSQDDAVAQNKAIIAALEAFVGRSRASS